MRFAQACEELPSANEMQIAQLRVLQTWERSVIPHTRIHFQIPKLRYESPPAGGRRGVGRRRHKSRLDPPKLRLDGPLNNQRGRAPDSIEAIYCFRGGLHEPPAPVIADRRESSCSRRAMLGNPLLFVQASPRFMELIVARFFTRGDRRSVKVSAVEWTDCGADNTWLMVPTAVAVQVSNKPSSSSELLFSRWSKFFT